MQNAELVKRGVKREVRTAGAKGEFGWNCRRGPPVSQLPLKSGSRFSMKALIASIRSFDIRNDEFHCAT